MMLLVVTMWRLPASTSDRIGGKIGSVIRYIARRGGGNEVKMGMVQVCAIMEKVAVGGDKSVHCTADPVDMTWQQ